jgi:hypothetical protein
VKGVDLRCVGRGEGSAAAKATWLRTFELPEVLATQAAAAPPGQSGNGSSKARASRAGQVVDLYLRTEVNPPYTGFNQCFANGVTPRDEACGSR